MQACTRQMQEAALRRGLCKGSLHSLAADLADNRAPGYRRGLKDGRQGAFGTAVEIWNCSEIEPNGLNRA